MRENKIYRCTCGAWSYTGIACSTCAIMRGEQDEDSGTTDQPART